MSVITTIFGVLAIYGLMGLVVWCTAKYVETR